MRNNYSRKGSRRSISEKIAAYFAGKMSKDPQPPSKSLLPNNGDTPKPMVGNFYGREFSGI